MEIEELKALDDHEKVEVLNNMIEEEEKKEKELLPSSIPKHNVHTFLNEVFKTDDTTKVANISEGELGNVVHPVRALKEFSIISDRMCENEWMRDYFIEEAEKVDLAPSLSRKAKLITIAVTQKKTIADETRIQNLSKNHFTKDKNPIQEED
jgi:hypothetical protein